MKTKPRFLAKWLIYPGLGLMGLGVVALTMGVYLRDEPSGFPGNSPAPNKSQAPDETAQTSIEEGVLAKVEEASLELANTLAIRDYQLDELSRKASKLQRELNKVANSSELSNGKDLVGMDKGLSIEQVDARLEQLPSAEQLLSLGGTQLSNTSVDGIDSDQTNSDKRNPAILRKINTPQWQAVMRAYAEETGIDVNALQQMMQSN